MFAKTDPGIAGILVAAITTLGSVVVAWMSHRKKKVVENKLTQAENYMRAEHQAMRYEHIFASTASTQNLFAKLLEESEIDRILLLIAWNGKEKPRWTKAIYQLRGGEQTVTEYVHTELDDDYRRRLEDTKKSTSGQIYRTEDLPEESLIGKIYRAERVKCSHWVFLRQTSYAEGECYSYFSFATHSVDHIAPDVLLRIRLLMDQIRSQAC